MTLPGGAGQQPARWWDGAVGYEVYIRSFADGDGDGVGDLHGLLARLDHLAWLGVDAVWITPFYPSPMLDHGYDVADYCDIEPVFGDLAAFDAVVARCRELGLRLVIDLVPNHSSSAHPWFTAALADPQGPYRDYYVWRDPAPDGGPPNNWRSHFGGPAWTLDEASGQYWLHLFLPEQPDLNWANPAVADEFDRILRFWLDRGVDGFRIDVAHALVKHPELPDLPPAPERGEGEASGLSWFDELDHVHDVNQPGVLDVYRRWRRIADGYGALLLGEVYVLDAEDLARYLEADDGLHLSFWFKPLHVGWDPAVLRDTLERAVTAIPRSLAWVQGSHDRMRPASRFGGGEVGRARALALGTLLLGLPGMPFVYQGDELGLTDGEVPPERAQDPIALRAGDLAASRDGCRTPIPWDPEPPGFGFTAAAHTWLPFGQRTDADTVAVQRADEGSLLHRFRALLALRRALPDLRAAEAVWLDAPAAVLAYRRGGVVVAANCGEAPASLGLPEGRWAVRFDTGRAQEGQVASGSLELAPCQAVVLQVRGEVAGDPGGA